MTFVWSANGVRRQLGKSQLAAIAVSMLPELKEEAKKRQLSGKGADGSGGRGNDKNLPALVREGLPAPFRNEAVAVAARIVGVGETVVRQALAVSKLSPELFGKIAAGEISVKSATKVLAGKAEKPTPLQKSQPRAKRLAIPPNLVELTHSDNSRLV